MRRRGARFRAAPCAYSVCQGTARERLTVHQVNPTCSGCHAITDPIGLSMENYDAVGAFRTHENGALIDASGDLDGSPYKNVIDLQRLLHDDPSAPACVVQRAFEYGVGRLLTPTEEKWLGYSIDRFAADKYQLPALMRRIATSPAFGSVAASAPLAPGKSTATR